MKVKMRMAKIYIYLTLVGFWYISTVSLVN